MIVVDEEFHEGLLVRSVVWDLNARTMTASHHGVVVEQRPMTVDEMAAKGFAALDPTGALAALLAVTGTLTVEDAANAVHLTPDALIAEAEAWAVAQSMSK